jgi:hypothetical protein
MGAKLKKAFDIAKNAGGMQAQMRLAMKSGMTADKAGAAEDSPANVQKMEAALKEVTGQAVKL